MPAKKSRTISSPIFANGFQPVVPSGDISLTHQELAEATDNVSFCQYVIDPVRVEKLVKAIIQDGLLKPITVASLASDPDKLYNVDGRHRFTAVSTICESYAINAAGAVVLAEYDTFGALLPELTEIDFELVCNHVIVDDLPTLVRLIEASNTSRVHTAVESLYGQEAAGLLAGEKKVQFAWLQTLKRVASEYTFTNNKGVFIDLANNDATLALLAAKLYSAIAEGKTKVMKYCSPELMERFASDFCQFLQANMHKFDSNFARAGYKDALAAFESYGSPEMMFDAEGDQVNGTYVEWVASQCRKPEKTTSARGSSKKLTEAQAQLAELQAEMARIKAIAAGQGVSL